MKIPSVIHPTRYTIRGIIFEVVSYVQLTDRQAQEIARTYYRKLKNKKKHVGKIVQAITMFDEDSSKLL